MSMVPMGGNKISPNPTLVSSYPDVYLSTGLVAENHARESTVSRAEQDAFRARQSPTRNHAIEEGPLQERDRSAHGQDRAAERR
jgi:acetyl-CoA acyltransferase